MTRFLSDPEARSFAQGGRVLRRAISDDLTPRIVDGLWQITAREGNPFTGGLSSPSSVVRANHKALLREPLASVCPCQPSSHVDLKETWGKVRGYIRYLYKARLLCFNDTPWADISFIKWHSPVTMPRTAVRWHMTVKTVEVVERDGVWRWGITMEER